MPHFDSILKIYRDSLEIARESKHFGMIAGNWSPRPEDEGQKVGHCSSSERLSEDIGDGSKFDVGVEGKDRARTPGVAEAVQVRAG